MAETGMCHGQEDGGIGRPTGTVKRHGSLERLDGGGEFAGSVEDRAERIEAIRPGSAGDGTLGELNGTPVILQGVWPDGAAPGDVVRGHRRRVAGAGVSD